MSDKPSSPLVTDGVPFEVDPAAAARAAGAKHHVVIPQAYTASYDYPLIVWLHADGGNERQVEEALPLISTRNHLAVGVRGDRAADVCGHRFVWSTRTSVVDQILAAVDHVDDQYSVNPRRVVLVGHGTGGAAAAIRAAMTAPDRFAGVVRLGGDFPSGGGLMKRFHELRRRQMPMLWLMPTTEQSLISPVLQSQIEAAASVACKLQVQLQVGQPVAGDGIATESFAAIDRWIFDSVICPPSDVVTDVSSLQHAASARMIEFSVN